jgi:uncharacterized coiled-coil DUF342 family protein
MDAEDRTPEQILDGIKGELEKLSAKLEYHETEAAKARKALADLNDLIAGRTRKPRSGKFTRKRKEKASGAAPESVV